MKRLYLLLVLLPLIAAVPNATVTLNVTHNAIPGATVPVSVHTDINGVRVISVPTELTVTWPDSSITGVPLTASAGGDYQGTIYLPLEGTYALLANVSLGGAHVLANASIIVAKPGFDGTVTVNATHVIVNATTNHTYDVRVMPPVPGALTDGNATAVCTVTCASCALACGVGDQVALIHVPSAFSYDFVRTAQHLPPVYVSRGTPVNTSGALLVKGTSLVALGSATTFTQNQTLVWPGPPARTQDVTVLDQGAQPVPATIGYDVATGRWYALVTSNVTGLVAPRIGNATIESATTLDGRPLPNTPTSVQSTGPFEAVLQSSMPAPSLPTINRTPYGALLRGDWQATFRLATDNGTVYALRGGFDRRASIDTFRLSGQEIYYASKDHDVLSAVPASLIPNATPDRFTPVLQGQPLSISLDNTSALLVLDENLSVVARRPAAVNMTWTPLLPPGRYFLLAQALGTVTPIEVVAPNSTIQATPAQNLTGLPNTQLVITRTITNVDWKHAHAIDIAIGGPYAALLEDSNGNRLTDTNLDGIPDTGVIAPGKSVTIVARILLPPGAKSTAIPWVLTQGGATLRINDSLIVGAPEQSFVSDDLEVSSMRSDGRTVTVSFFNHDVRTHQVALDVTYQTAAGNDTSRQSQTLPPGASNATITIPSATQSVRVAIQANDSLPQDNARTLRIWQPPGAAIHVSEQAHIDHASFTVKAIVPKGEWRITYPDASGNTQVAPSTVVGTLANGSEKIVFSLPLPANTDLLAGLSPGAGPTFDPYRVVDDGDPGVQSIGTWYAGTQVPGYHGAGYHTDLGQGRGQSQMRFFLATAPAYYELEVWHPGDPSFASNARIRIGNDTVLDDQRQPAQWDYLGRYWMNASIPVTVTDAAADGVVVADAFRVLRVDEYANPFGAPSVQPHAPQGLLVYDSHGQEVRATVSLSQHGHLRKSGLLPSQARANNGTYDVEFSFPNGPVSNLTVHGASPATMGLGIESVPASRAKRFTDRAVVDAYAIDPSFNTSYTVTRIAKGSELLKCADYNFSTQTCNGGFVEVMALTPGEPYSVTLTPGDPLLVEVSDLVLPPFYADCQSNGGNYSTSTCSGTYDNGTPACNKELTYCNEAPPSPNKETFNHKTNYNGSMNATYGNESMPLRKCDVIHSVSVDYQVWGDNTGNSYSIYVDPGYGVWTPIVSGVNVNSTTEPTSVGSQNATAVLPGAESWNCSQFFGPNPTARIRIDFSNGGNPNTQHVSDADYLVYRIAYNFTKYSLELDKTTYVQGETVQISGTDIYDPSALVSINITKGGSFVAQVNVTTNSTGGFKTNYTIADYAPLGLYSLYAWQRNNTAINATNNYTVTKRSPTVQTQIVGDYFNRSQLVEFTGSHWAKGATVTVNATNPEGELQNGYPTNTTTNSSGDLNFNWTVPSGLDTLTGPYTFNFTEYANNSYSATKIIHVVILPSTAEYWQGGTFVQSELGNVTKKDGVYAQIVASTAGLDMMNMTFPSTMYAGMALSNLSLNIYHKESSTNNVYVDWYNISSATWVTLCIIPYRAGLGLDSCDITQAVNTSNYMNRVWLRLTDGNLWKNPQSPTYDYDIAFLSVNFTYPAPNVSLVSPPNNTWYNTASHALTYNATDGFFNISQCRVYVNGALVDTNSSFTVNTSDTYTHTFTQGNDTWYAACDDDSARYLTGTSATRNVLIDLTAPNSSITVPATNYTWYNTTTPSVNFTAQDNMASTLNWTLYVNGTQDSNGTMANATTHQQTLAAQPQGLRNITLEVWDQAYNYATNKTVLLYVDTTAPTVTPNTPVEGYNTSSTSVTFNWTASDNLDPYIGCDVYVDGALNTSASVVNGQTNATTVTGFTQGQHNWSVSCTDKAGNAASTVTRNFTVDTQAPTVLLENPANNTVVTTTRTIQLDYNVSDNLLPVPQCSLYINDTLNQTNTSITQGTTQSFWLTSVQNGNYSWNVECQDLVGNAANSTQRNVKEDVRVIPLPISGGSYVSRDGPGAGGWPAFIALQANLTDGAPGVLVNFTANLTDPLLGQTDVYLGQNTTNASGTATFWWNPSTSIHGGNWSWWPQSAGSDSLGSRTLDVLFNLTLAYQNATLDPGPDYNATQTVGLNFTVSSLGETASQLNSSYGVFVEADLHAPNTSSYFVDMNGSGNFSGTYVLPSDAPVGVWNVTAWTHVNSGFTDYTGAANTLLITRNFTVKGASDSMNPADGTVVDRDGYSASDPDVIPLVMRIPGAGAGYTVNFTANLTDPAFAGQNGLLLGSNTTNATGYATLWFNPNSSYYAGNYTWWGESVISFFNSTHTFIIKGAPALAPSSAVADPNAVYNQTDTVTLQYNASSQINKETQAQLGNNYSLTVEANYSPQSAASPMSNITLLYNGVNWSGTGTIGYTAPVGTWNLLANMTGPYTYLGTSSTTFVVHGLSNLTLSDTSASTIVPVYTLDNFTANYSDTSMQPIHTASSYCEARFNVSGGWTVYKNMTYDAARKLYWFNRSFNRTYAGAAFDVYCDDPLYASQNKTSTYTISRTTAAMNTANGTRVDRDSVSADPDTLLLNASIPSAPAGVTIDFYLNLTDPALGQTDLLLGSNTTDANGNAVYVWNPNATVYAGNVTVFANSTYADPSTTSDALVYGGLQQAFSYASVDPNASYYQQDVIAADVNLTSPGPETASQLNASYSASSNATHKGPSNSGTVGLVYNGTFWRNDTYQIPIGTISITTWNTTVASGATYFYPPTNISRSYIVYPLTVCINETGVCYKNVQTAVDAASAGQHVVIIDNRTYVENVTVNKDITITSNGTGLPTILGNDTSAITTNQPLRLARLNISIQGTAANQYGIKAANLNLTDSVVWTNVTGSGSSGVYASGTGHVTLRSVNLTGINATSLIGGYSSTVTLNDTRVLGTVASGGIELSNGVLSAHGLYINTTKTAINMPGGSKDLHNITVYGNNGVLLGSDANLTDSTINVSNTGVGANGNVTIKNSTIYGGNYGVNTYNTADQLFIIDSIVSAGGNVLFVNAGGTGTSVQNITVRNSSITPATTVFTGVNTGETAIVYYQHYLDVYVNNTLGSAVSGATVNATDALASQVFSVTTAANGSITRQNVTYATDENGTVTTLTNHTVSAGKTGYHDESRSVNMTQNQDISITLGDYMNVTTMSLAPSTIYAYQSTTASCTVSDQRTGSAVSGATVGFYRNGTSLGTNTTNSSGVLTLSFNVNATGSWLITCNVSDQPSSLLYAGNAPQRNATLTVDPFAIQPVSPVNGTSVDRDGVNATMPDVILLNVSVPSWVPNGVSISFLANRTAPFTGGPYTLGSNTTSGGNAVLYYNPNSSSYAGAYRWYGNSGTAGGPNGSRTYAEWGAFNLSFWNVSSYPNANYTQNETLHARFNLTSLGPESRSQLNSTYGGVVQLNVSSVNGQDTNTTSFVNPYWQGSYGLLVLAGVGNWNVSGNASASYFFPVSVSGRNTTVYGYMNVTSASLSRSTIYAYQSTVQSCEVRDQDTNVSAVGATVSFYRNGTLLGTNTTNSSGGVTYSFQTNVSGTYSVSCNVSDQLSIYYYAGNVPGRSTSLTVLPFPVTPVGPSNATAVDRDSGSASIPDVILLNVSVPSYVPNGVAITFTQNLTSPFAVGPTVIGSNTTSGGFAVLYYNPNSSTYAGIHSWWGGSTQASTNGTRTYVSYGTPSLVFWNATVDPDANYTQNQTMLVRFNYTSPGPESRSQLNSSYSGAVQLNVSSVNGKDTNTTSFVNPIWQGSYGLLALAGVGNWNITGNASASYFLNVSASIRNTTVYGYMNVTSASLASSTIYSYQSTAQSCAVHDEHTGVAVQGASVSFYRNGTLLGTNTTNSSGGVTFSFQTNTTGTYSVSCNVSDQPSIYYYAGNVPAQSSSLTVTPFPITIVSPVNGTAVDRDSGSASIPDVILLNVSVPSWVPNGVSISFLANRTTPFTGGPYTLGSNTTSGGNALLYYNPNSSSYAGAYLWYADSSAGIHNGTRTYLSYGTPSLTFWNVTVDPNANYTQNDTLHARFNLTSPGPESRSQLNSTYGGVVQLNVSSVNGQDTNVTSFVNPYWDGSYRLLALAGVGNWTVSGNASASYFLNVSASQRNTTIYGYMNVTSASLSPSTIYAYQPTAQTCEVRDQDTNVAVSGATVSFYRNSTLLGTNTTNSSGGVTYSFQTNVSGTYSVSCNVSDQFGIYYYAGNAPGKNATLTVLPFPVTPVSPSNTTTVDRDSGSATMPDVVLLNVSVPSYVPNGVAITFSQNLTSPFAVGPTTIGSNTTSGGHAVLYYNPNSSTYAGVHEWWGGSTQASTNGTRTYISYGTPSLKFWNVTVDPNANYTQNDTLYVLFNLTSPGPETRSQLNATYSGAVQLNVSSVNGNDTNTTIFVGPYWNGSYSLLALAGVGNWTVTGNASASYFFNVSASQRNTTVYGYMNVTSASLSASSAYAWQIVTQTCRVQDEHTGVAVAAANVSFYRNGTLLATNLTNSTGYATTSFTTSTTGTYAVSCNVSDQYSIYYLAGGQPSGNDTLSIIPFPITPVAPNNATGVDRDGVNATMTDVILLNVSVPSQVSDGVTITFYANRTAPFTGGPYTLGSNITLGGHAVLYYNPNSSSYAGAYRWYGDSGTAGDPNGTRTYDEYGGLNLTFWNASFYPAANYTQNGTLVARFNLTSLGPESRSQLNATYSGAVQLNVSSVNGNDTNTTTFFSPYWTGSYGLLALKGVGKWNVSGNASASYFFPASIANRNTTVYGYMNVTSASLSPSTIYSYQSTFQACAVRDEHTGVAIQGATVSFYRNSTLLGTNTTNSSGGVTYSFQTNVSGTYAVSCNVSDQLGIYYYAGDAPGQSASLTVLPFPVTPISPANATAVDRDSVNATMPDVVLLNVSVPSYVPNGVAITFSQNLTSPFAVGPTTIGSNTTIGGHAVLYYNPNATTYSGVHAWWAAGPDGGENGTRTYDEWGALNLTFWNSSTYPNANYTENGTLVARYNLTSLGPETRSELNASYGGAVQVNVSSVNGNDTNTTTFFSPYWTGSYGLLTLAGVGNWTVSGNASASYFFPASMAGRNTTVYGYMDVVASSTTPLSSFDYQYVTQTCLVNDQHTNAAVQGAIVSFYRNSTLLGTNTTNSMGSASFSFQTNSSGTYKVTCNVSDQPSIYYLAGNTPGQSAFITVYPFPVTPVSPSNATAVDRDSGSASIPDVILLNISVPSYVPDGVNITFSQNLTSPFAVGPTTIGTNTTVGGHAVLYYNPNSTTYAGVHSWWGSGADGGINGTRTYTSYGTPSLVFWNATADPNKNYTQNQTMRVRFNYTSPGPETRSQLNASYSGVVQMNVSSVNGNDTNTTTFLDPYWQGSYSLLALAGVGNWTVSGNASASYFLNVSASQRNTTIYGYMNVTSASLASSTIYAFQSTAQSCEVRDQDTNVSVAGATVLFYRNSTLLGTNTTNSSGGVTYSFQTNTTGSYSVSCNVSDQLGIYYYAGNAPGQNASLTVLPFPITPVSPSNSTQVDRDSASASMPDSILLNVSVPSWVPDGVTVTFGANTSTPVSQGPLTLGSNTTSGGYAVLTYDPSSTVRAGHWVWDATSAQGSSNGSRTYDVYGALHLVFNSSAQDPASTYDQNGTATAALNLTTVGPETRDQLNGSYLGSVNVTYVSVNGQSVSNASYTSPYWLDTFNLLDLSGVGVWNVSANATADYMIATGVANKNFTVYGYANITNATLVSSSIPVFSNATLQCRLQDEHTNASVPGAQVAFYWNGTLQGNATTNATGWAQRSFAINTQGTFNVTCVFVSQPAIYYKAGDAPNATTQVTVTPYYIDSASPTNGTVVDRDSVSSDPDVVRLVAQASSSIPARNFTFYANLTSPSLGVGVIEIGKNQTNSSGAAVLYWNPNGTVYAGTHSWWANDSGAGLANNTRTVDVKGGLNVSFQSATLDPNAEYNQTQTADINATLASLGPETGAEINASYLASMNTTLMPPTTASSIAQMLYGGTIWNGSHTFSLTAEVGDWVALVNVSANHFYVDTTNRSFVLIGLSNLTLSDQSDFGIKRVYQNFTFYANYSDSANTPINTSNTTCEIRFNDTGSFGAYANMTYDAGTGLYVYWTNFSNDGNFTDNVYCSDKYYVPQNVSDTFIVNKTAINDLSPANDTAVDRDNASATMNDTVKLVVNMDHAVAGVLVNFTLMNRLDPSGSAGILIGQNTTIAGGNTTLYWNPNSTVAAGLYEWGAYADKAAPNRTRTIAVYGSLNVTYFNSSDPNAQYNQTNNATFLVNITTPGPESAGALDSSYNLSADDVLIEPYTGNISVPLALTGTMWNGSYVFPSTVDPGIWNTSVNVSAAYFFNTTVPLRSFALWGISNLSAFDEQDLYGYLTYVGQDAFHFANWTAPSGAPITTGTCTLTRYDGSNVSMTYDSSLKLWSANSPYYIEGIARYNITCGKLYFWNMTAQNNITIQSLVNLSTSYELRNLSADEWQVLLNVTNLQNYTQQNVSLYSLVHDGLTGSYNLTPVSSSTVTGADPGLAVRWHFDNLTAGQTAQVAMNVTGSGDWYPDALLGVSSPTYSTVVYG